MANKKRIELYCKILIIQKQLFSCTFEFAGIERYGPMITGNHFHFF